MLFRDPAAPQRSSAKLWSFTARFIAAEEEPARSVEKKGSWVSGLYEFLRFGIKQGWACLFGGLMLALLIATKLWYPAEAFLTRYDFLFIAAVLTQGALIATRLETLEEAKVILLFHVVGTVMEIFKTSVGSWAYPEASMLKIGGAPLFAGFQYALGIDGDVHVVPRRARLVLGVVPIVPHEVRERGDPRVRNPDRPEKFFNPVLCIRGQVEFRDAGYDDVPVLPPSPRRRGAGEDGAECENGPDERFHGHLRAM